MGLWEYNSFNIKPWFEAGSAGQILGWNMAFSTRPIHQ